MYTSKISPPKCNDIDPSDHRTRRALLSFTVFPSLSNASLHLIVFSTFSFNLGNTIELKYEFKKRWKFHFIHDFKLQVANNSWDVEMLNTSFFSITDYGLAGETSLTIKNLGEIDIVSFTLLIRTLKGIHTFFNKIN